MARVSDLKLNADRVPLIPNADVVKVLGLTSYCVERVGNYLYLTGGLVKGQYRNVHSVVGLLDITQERWRWLEYEGKDIKNPTIFLYNDALYAYCQNDWTGSRKGEISRFDLSVEEWSYCNSIGRCPGYKHLSLAEYLESLQRFVVFRRVSELFPAEVYLFAMPDCRWVKSVVKGTPPLTTRSLSSCVHQGVIFCCRDHLELGNVHDMFVLHVGINNEATWSSLKIGPVPMPLKAQRLASFYGKLLLSGGFSARFNPTNTFAVYDPETQEVETVALPPKQLEYFGYRGAVFTLVAGQDFGYLNAQDDLYRYVRVTLDE